MPVSKRGYDVQQRPPKWEPERRIVLPQILKRPVRFRASSLLKGQIKNPDVYWFTLHRRGPHRDQLGGNPLEARAVPHTLVKGTLPERIIYRWVVSVAKMVPGFDFDFQASEQGGRVEMGGLVVDFLFPYLMIALNPLGPTHNQFGQMKKDEEQISILAHMGYTVYMIPEADVYNEFIFENLMRRIFNFEHLGSGSTEIDEQTNRDLDVIYDRLMDLRSLI